MSSIVGALTGGGGSGMAYHPERAPIMQPVTDEQLLQAQAGVTGALGQQQRFATAVNGQNGLQNQSNTFNQLQGVANGTGPNPAQAQLANATGANTANQAAVMASQRGAGSNAGMIARQAAMQGGANQQQSAGQSAALQAQQSLGALGQMGGLSTSQANLAANVNNSNSANNLAAQQNLLGATGAYNNANVGMQSNMNSSAGALAQGVAGQQGGMFNQLMGSIGSAGNLFSGSGSGGLGAIGGGGTETAGGAADSAGSGLMDGGTMIAAKGGLVPQYKDGGEAKQSADQSTLSGFIQHLFTEGPNTVSNPDAKQAPELNQQKAKDFEKSFNGINYADGGTVTELDPVGPQSNVAKSFMDEQDALGAPQLNTSAETGKTTPPGGKHGMGSMGALGQGGGGQSIDMSGVKSQGEHEMNNYKELVKAPFNFYGQESNVIDQNLGPAGMPIMKYLGMALMAAKGGQVPALVSPGEQYLPPKDVKKVAKGANPLAEGERIPGKPKVKGNSYANDTVSKTLESGGIVIPNSVMQSKDPEKKAAEFVRAIIAKQGLKSSLKKGK